MLPLQFPKLSYLLSINTSVPCAEVSATTAMPPKPTSAAPTGQITDSPSPSNRFQDHLNAAIAASQQQFDDFQAEDPLSSYAPYDRWLLMERHSSTVKQSEKIDNVRSEVFAKLRPIARRHSMNAIEHGTADKIGNFIDDADKSETNDLHIEEDDLEKQQNIVKGRLARSSEASDEIDKELADLPSKAAALTTRENKAEAEEMCFSGKNKFQSEAETVCKEKKALQDKLH